MKNKKWWLFCLCCLFVFPIFAQSNPSSKLYHSLLRFKETKRILFVAAHPDDENTRLIAYLANAEHAEVAYLSLTRGDGGQNLIGSELGIELGLIRTQELLRARETDGGRQFFTRALDFGFSKNPDETFNNWDKKKLLSDVVWIIRKYQPDVILVWGPYWGEIADLPAGTKRKVIGAPAAIVEAVARERELAAVDQAHLTNTVFVASQAHATKKIAKFLLAAAAAHPTFFFTLKQHPQEAPVDFEALADKSFRKGKLASARVPSNLLLADPKVNTLEAMARSEFVLGVYTTALFEAFALGCKVGVLAFSGWQHIRALVERGDATLISDLAELDKFLKSNSGKDVSADRVRADFYYAKPASEADLWAAIKIAE